MSTNFKVKFIIYLKISDKYRNKLIFARTRHFCLSP